MSEEIDFSDTERKVGQLLPVLVNPKGEIIDGRHRLKYNKNWKRVQLDLDPLHTHVARLVVNTQRRITDEEDYNEFAKFLQKHEPGEKLYLVKSGVSIAERISGLTGIPHRKICDALDDEYTHPGGRVAEVSNLRTKQMLIRIPKPVVESVENAVKNLKQVLEEKPEKAEATLKTFNDTLELAGSLVKIRATDRKKREKKEPHEDWSPKHFIKKLNKASSDVTFLIELPSGVIGRVLHGMNDLDRETCQTLIRDLVEAATKLQAALEGS